jgi:hypothetical protein
MQAVDLKELVKNAKEGTEQEVREALEVIRRVEELGVGPSRYSLAPPFSRTGSLGGPVKHSPARTQRQ